MLRVGLTGGVATGKSAVGKMLQARGWPLLDTDELARRFTQPGRSELAAMVDYFGRSILDARGELDRAALAERIFNLPDERRFVEGLLHPPIRAAWLRQLVDWREAGEVAGWIVIPLLYETRSEAEFDAIICTGCSADTQQRRLRERGWSGAQIAGRLAAQLPLCTKLERADFVIWTEGSPATTEAQLEEVLCKLDPVLRPTA
jgi:dephospho-CoA kinase